MDKISRTCIGIDLGTSNSAIAISTSSNEVQSLDIFQCTDPGKIGTKQLLPSAIYLASESEFAPEALKLPWQEGSTAYCIGSFAREHGALVPDRLISSAKSWLSVTQIDRNKSILPWKSDTVDQKVSPFEASRRYIEHLRKSCLHNEIDINEGDVVVTVPASFDETARQLTYQAAIEAGVDKLTLLEEPLAAFYAWLSHCGESWRELLAPGDLVLVCDIGGGTADFTLVAVHEQDGNLELQRISVGEHILLGGDNMDLALALLLQQELEESGHSLDKWQFQSLLLGTKQAKETLFSDEDLADFTIAIPSRGASLFLKTITVKLTQSHLEQVIIEGFFPICEVNESPKKTISAGIKEFGLPYASDAVVSKHIAKFLRKSLDNVLSDQKLIELTEILDESFLCPTAVLFNGGVFKAEAIRTRVLNLLSSWSSERNIRELPGADLDLAVAKGASHYGSLKYDPSLLRIRSGASHSYYIGLQTSALAVPGLKPQIKALCVVPQGMEEGTSISLTDNQFSLLTGETVQFRFFSSTSRAGDKAGELVNGPEQLLTELPALQVSLPPKTNSNDDNLVPVRLDVTFTELGILELSMVDCKSNEKWILEFNLRTREDSAPPKNPKDTKLQAKASEHISLLYGKRKKVQNTLTPQQLVRELERTFKQPRDRWNAETLRSLWPPLSRGMTRKARSLEHERTWLYLSGYALRPGYGDRLDPQRINDLWRCFELGLSFANENSVKVQWYIMWRRVSGGLDNQQQIELAEQIFPIVQNGEENVDEAIRLLGSLERIEPERKEFIAEALMRQYLRKGASSNKHYLWAIGRLSSRIPVYANPRSVIGAETVSKWFEQVSSLDWRNDKHSFFNNMFAQACRKTGDSSRDISEDLRKAVVEKMRISGASSRLIHVVNEAEPLEESDLASLFGEALPPGLMLL